MSFGQALKTLQGKRKAVAIGRRALGKEATGDEVRDFANYLSRITRDKVPNVGLHRLQLIALGLGLTPLSSFFARIEALQAGTAPHEDQAGSP